MSNNGRRGELLFSEKAQQCGYTVEDTTNNPQYFYKDIDFLVTNQEGIQKSFEIKWDSRISQTNNLYLELTNIHSKEGKGWFKFCEADYLAYGDAVNEIFYIIPLQQLKDRVYKGKKSYRVARCGDDSTGILVNLDDIRDIFLIFK